MVEATNYIYLALLIGLQYLGLQHESYQVSIDFSKEEGFEQRAPVAFGFKKIENKTNQWMVISPDQKHKIPLTIVKNSVTDFEGGKAKTVNFSEINFDKLDKQKDTIYNKKKVAIATILKNNKSIEFKILDNSFYEQITMTITE
ncbi:hypothetical protein FF125_01280 [Aureibaculum algae]|uniref:Uncharacterized protein n=1 Tax=Aureibaculum algae TaxID=2584122 RepID=A0A5B7TLF9_9FLAO|nr:hypothetical protein [Aureibaculum algae]QCX37135.1 hypothetical protein FF125_01280 [Aureibaculum algae]